MRNEFYNNFPFYSAPYAKNKIVPRKYKRILLHNQKKAQMLKERTYKSGKP
ncbi:hypothetical protein LR48_Vigan670s000300 [Vigna angularis]|uniref:Uncharacterized protein n=1 Tax=Phaseolus angularis TaxID=3914 RepID=A0A0L9TH01_PHAAN|nr:hypothetical protein LR48_Vigan670s000300 [Vigna angularis]